MAGQGSALHGKHKVWLHRVGVANLPEDYTTRLSEMASGQFKRFKISFLTPTTASCPNSSEPARKTGMTDYLFRSQKLDAQVLRDRYKNELGHNLIGKIEWHDQTLELWIDIFTAPR